MSNGEYPRPRGDSVSVGHVEDGQLPPPRVTSQARTEAMVNVVGRPACKLSPNYRLTGGRINSKPLVMRGVATTPDVVHKYLVPPEGLEPST